MALSVFDPIDKAVSRTSRVLFRDFDIQKWFVLGFCAFLAHLGEGGGFNGNLPGGRGGRGPGGEEATQWVWAHLGLIMAIVLAVCILILALAALFQWLSSRGKFMFLDGVVRDRGAVVEPWRRFRELGNNLFFFRFFLGLAVFVIIMAVLVAATLLAWQDIRFERFGGGAVAALLLIGLVLVPTAIIAGIISLLLNDMVVPIMYRRDIRVIPAFRVLTHEILPGNILSFVLFYLMRILIGVVFAIVTIVGCCLTCCIAVLPYISSVVFLPLLVFTRSYSVYFLEQAGPEWSFFGEGAADGEVEIV